MMSILKKSTAFALALCIVALLVFQLGIIFGSDVSSAGSSSELWLKDGYNYMLVNGVRKKINSKVDTAAPYFYQGETMTAYVPLTAVAAYYGGSYTTSGETVTLTVSSSNVCTFTVGSAEWKRGGTAQTPFMLPVAEKDGEIYLTNASVKSVYGSTVNAYINFDTGLIVYGKASLPYNSSYTSLKSQIAEIDSLLYDLPNATELYQDIQNYAGITTHPKLLVDQARFDEIRAVYEKTGALTEDEITFKSYINRVLSRAGEYFGAAFDETETGAKLKGENGQDGIAYFRQPYYVYDANGNRVYGTSNTTMADGTALTEYWQNNGWSQSSAYNEGYDVGGRSSLDKRTVNLKFYAFAWQITRQQKWADAFYLGAMEISKWEHWGEGHYLNNSDGSVEFALGFDWIYPAFSGTAEGQAKLRQMAETIFVLGVEVGYHAMNNDEEYKSAISNLTNANLKKRNQPGTLHSSKIMGENWKFHWTNNWQTVCISGMVISAIAVMEYSDMKNVCTGLIAELLPRVNECLMQYAPDGSYIESAGYWGYSTRTFMLMIASLESAMGTSYGFLDTVGLHESYYFATYITDANFYAWSYHDGGRSRVDSTTFYLASKLWDDPNLSMVRDLMFDAGIKAEVTDVLFYDPSLSVGGEREKLDYFGKNIDTVTVRSSWESDAIFAGLHAGANSVSHGDIDSGNFYLASGNTIWFGDRGGENYTVAQFKNEASNDYFDGRYRYLYYKKSVVAHNTVFLLSDKLPRGQAFNSMSDSYARIESFNTDSLGTVAIANMTAQFNKRGDTANAICSSAKRGLLFTNSRSTVVIQDEMTFKTPTDLVWSAESDKIVSLSEDGKTAYLRSGRVTMRVSLVSEDPNLKFTLLTDKTETFLTYNDVTDGLYSSTKNEGQIVTKTNTGNQLASDPYDRLIVQMNDVTKFNMAIVCELIDDDREVVGYEWKSMSEWQTVSDSWVKEANQWIEDEKNVEYKYSNSDLIKAMSRYDEAATSAEKFLIVRELYNIINSIDPKTPGVSEKIESCKSYISKFNVSRGKVNSEYQQSFFLDMKKLLGFDY